MTAGKLTGLGGEVTVDGVARLLVGEVRHGLERRCTCARTKATLSSYNHNTPHLCGLDCRLKNVTTSMTDNVSLNKGLFN